MSLDRLMEAIERKKNPTALGLDPKLAYIPDYIKAEAYASHGKTFEGAAEAILRFNKGLIDALCDIVPAVKPQCAYYEMYGWQGVKALAETIEYARGKGMFVITDGKRGDIHTTMEAYGAAHLGETDIEGTKMAAFGGDALTVNGYLGTDGIFPLVGICNEYDKGMFVLCKTSNPSSGDLQDRHVEGKPVYEIMGEFCELWGEQVPGGHGYSGVGAVVGATYPEQLKELRGKMPGTFFLVPGYGAQGGGARQVAGAFDKDGRGAVINSSRAIMCAYRQMDMPPREYAAAARAEAVRMRDDIKEALK